MTQQFTEQQVPSIRVYDEDTLESSAIDYIDVQEIIPETSARIAKHPGESGKVYADTRTVQPARYRAKIIIPEMGDDAFGLDPIQNLLNASHKPPIKYTVTSFFSRCYNMMVVSSRNRDSTDMANLRIQDVVFEECLTDNDDEINPTSFEDEPCEIGVDQYVGNAGGTFELGILGI